MSPAFCMDNDCNQGALNRKCHATPPPPTPVVVSTSSTPSASPSPTITPFPSPTPSRSPSLTLMMMTSPQPQMPQIPQTQTQTQMSQRLTPMTRTGSVGGTTSAARRNSLWLETLRNTRKLSYANERPILVRLLTLNKKFRLVSLHNQRKSLLLGQTFDCCKRIVIQLEITASDLLRIT